MIVSTAEKLLHGRAINQRNNTWVSINVQRSNTWAKWPRRLHSIMWDESKNNHPKSGIIIDLGKPQYCWTYGCLYIFLHSQNIHTYEISQWNKHLNSLLCLLLFIWLGILGFSRETTKRTYLSIYSSIYLCREKEIDWERLAYVIHCMQATKTR